MADGTRLTKFDGTNSESWISKAEEFFEFYRTEDSTRITIAAFYFDGKARRWYCWMKSNRQLSCWSHFTKAVRERFPNTDLEPSQGYQSRFETLSNQTRREENAAWNQQLLDIADELIRIGQHYKCSMLKSLDIPQVFDETLERLDDVIGDETISDDDIKETDVKIQPQIEQVVTTKKEISEQVETLEQYNYDFEKPVLELMEHTLITPTVHHFVEFLEEPSDASQLFDKMSTRVVDILVVKVTPPWMFGSPSKGTYETGNSGNKHSLSQLMFDRIYAMMLMDVNNYVEIHDPYVFRLLLMGRSFVIGALDVNVLVHYMFRLLVMGKLICNVDVEIVANARSCVVMLHLCLVVYDSLRLPFHEHIIIVNEVHHLIEFMVIPKPLESLIFQHNAGPSLTHALIQDKPFDPGLNVAVVGCFFAIETVLRPLCAENSPPFTSALIVSTFVNSSTVSNALLGIESATLCKGSGLVGGLCAPSLMIGAAVDDVFGGSAAGIINSAILGNAATAQQQTYALAGITSTLASVCSVPLTSVLLLFVLAKYYKILLPLMGAVGLAIWIPYVANQNKETEVSDTRSSARGISYVFAAEELSLIEKASMLISMVDMFPFLFIQYAALERVFQFRMEFLLSWSWRHLLLYAELNIITPRDDTSETEDANWLPVLECRFPTLLRTLRTRFVSKGMVM